MKTLLLLSAVVTAMMVMPLAATAVPPNPTFGTAVVDGQYGEWNLVNDFFSNMYRAGDSTKAMESKLYLRYDCITNTMYVLVLCEPGVPGYIDPTAATGWIAIDRVNNKVVNENSGNNGVPPDFAWIGRGYDGNPQHVQGYEASFHILPGTYEIIAHINVWDDALGTFVAVQTSATPGFPKSGPDLVILDMPSAVQPISLGALKAMYR
ncbi:MAG: hypothetical protein V1694_00635 [Candidatus Eisenbacteria bacterium]